jgi:acyl transferase domain-containing protein
MQMLEALAGLFVRGVPMDWAALHRTPARRRIALPTYPWQREEHWLDGVPASRVQAGSGAKLETAAGATTASDSGEIVRRLLEARVVDRPPIALEYVAQQVATVLRVNRPESLDPRQRWKGGSAR